MASIEHSESESDMEVEEADFKPDSVNHGQLAPKERPVESSKMSKSKKRNLRKKAKRQLQLMEIQMQQMQLAPKERPVESSNMSKSKKRNLRKKAKRQQQLMEIQMQQIPLTPKGSPPEHRRRLMPPSPDRFDDDDLPPCPFPVNIPTPTQSTSGASQLQSPEAEKISCPICLDDDKTIKESKRKLASTTCGHVFCTECIDMAVRSQRCCPVCRTKLTLQQFHTLHI